ncbi:hypothetical protein CWO85_02990 [Candidatus Phytoplasma ziziphi]|uniref:Uncharacterized protein n=1 Tax=Ziziphus jujuba witches'-broom phytoplasma TaxID=135727 RepID=A0A660HN62_ZIZJU|nr:hypothetical protein CWO85_02990 [Candidatus Phytoplasma ziziphi]
MKIFIFTFHFYKTYKYEKNKDYKYILLIYFVFLLLVDYVGAVFLVSLFVILVFAIVLQSSKNLNIFFVF